MWSLILQQQKSFIYFEVFKIKPKDRRFFLKIYLVNFMLNFSNLVDSQHHLPTLAKWFHNEWGYLHPGSTLESRLRELNLYLINKNLPECFILEQEENSKNKLIASASIVDNDMDTRQDLFPWLASVYVDKKLRRKGFGQIVVKKAMLKAKNMGFKNLYLFTPDQENWYKNFGWNKIERTIYRDTEVTLMGCML